MSDLDTARVRLHRAARRYARVFYTEKVDREESALRDLEAAAVAYATRAPWRFPATRTEGQ